MCSDSEESGCTAFEDLAERGDFWEFRTICNTRRRRHGLDDGDHLSAVERLWARCGSWPRPPKAAVVVICIGVGLWVGTFAMAAMAMYSLRPASSHSEGAAPATVLLEESVTESPEEICPCACQEGAMGNGAALHLPPVGILHSRPLPTVPPLPTMPPLQMPRWPERPLPTARPLPPSEALAPLGPPLGPGSAGIHDGTICRAKRDAPLFASLTSWLHIGEVRMGQVVVAAGPPELTDGYLMLPIRPKGAVEVQALVFQERQWECHEWDFSDRAQRDFSLPSQKPFICERDRGDGFEYRYTFAGNDLLAPGCGDCWCCRRKDMAAEARRLTGALGDSLVPFPEIGPRASPVPWPGHLGEGMGHAWTLSPPAVAPQPTPWSALLATRQPPPSLIHPPVEPAGSSGGFVPLESRLSPASPLPSLPPLPELAPMLETPPPPRADAREEKSCRAGDTCAYGQTWCSKLGHQSFEPVGYCKKRKCDGPDGISTFPNHTCDSPSLPTIQFEQQLSNLPAYVHDHVLSNVSWLNSVFNAQLKWHGLEGFELFVDEVLTSSFEWGLHNTTATWLVGCWPPQRYLVTDGWVHFPAGRVTLHIGGINIIVSVYNLRASFRQLRADIECHGGWFYLGGVGNDAEGLELTVDRFEASGEVDIECEFGTTAFCVALMIAQQHLSSEVVKWLPQFLTAWLGNTKQMPLGPGCPEALRNSVSVTPYSSKECCEESFATDRWGCLVGGQFNGRHRNNREEVHSVTCEPSPTEPGTWTARCDSIPGTYKRSSPGICQESDRMPWEMESFKAPAASEDTPWMRTLTGLRYFARADQLLTLALLWCSVASCCVACRTCGGLRSDVAAFEVALAKVPGGSPFGSRLPSPRMVPRRARST